MSGPNVVWAMVSYGPMPFPRVYSSHLRAAVAADRYLRSVGGTLIGLGASDRMYTHSAENLAVENAQAIEGATHVFLTEQDMILPEDTIQRLVELDKPIAAGLYFLRGGSGQPCLYVKTVTPATNPYPHSPVSLFPTEQPFKLGDKGGVAGLGCMLVRLDVFAAIDRPWFDLRERDAAGTVGYGSDMYFGTKARDAGFEVWIDPRVRCGHMDYVEVGFDDYVRRLRDDPAFGKSGYICAVPEVAGG